MIYTGGFLNPPRPERAIPKDMLRMYESRGWIAQFKKNGTYSEIILSPERQLTSFTRHGERHKAWSWSEGSSQAFLTLPVTGWNVICAELLHSKVPGLRDIHFVHDILVHDGQWLLGSTYAQRYALLQKLFMASNQNRLMTPSHIVIDQHTWLARNIRDHFVDALESITANEDEGLVVKNPQGKLQVANNAGWAVKCRVKGSRYVY